MPICICLYVTWCLYGKEPVNCSLQCMGVDALSCLSYWLCFEENSQECGILSSLYSVPLSNYSVASVNVFVFTFDIPWPVFGLSSTARLVQGPRCWKVPGRRYIYNIYYFSFGTHASAIMFVCCCRIYRDKKNIALLRPYHQALFNVLFYLVCNSSLNPWFKLDKCAHSWLRDIFFLIRIHTLLLFVPVTRACSIEALLVLPVVSTIIYEHAVGAKSPSSKGKRADCLSNQYISDLRLLTGSNLIWETGRPSPSSFSAHRWHLPISIQYDGEKEGSEAFSEDDGCRLSDPYIPKRSVNPFLPAYELFVLLENPPGRECVLPGWEVEGNFHVNHVHGELRPSLSSSYLSYVFTRFTPFLSSLSLSTVSGSSTLLDKDKAF